MNNPYKKLPAKSFWSRSVSDRHYSNLENLFSPLEDLENSKFATAGSCFAQYIGKQLIARGLSYMDYEPPPPFLDLDQKNLFGYGIYSCRYGNIYTVRQLLHLFEEAFEATDPNSAIIWIKDGRYFDALRPGLIEGGLNTELEIIELRESHLNQVRKMFLELDYFVFTMGLTEAWISKNTGTVYPIAPGVIAGSFNSEETAFKNFTFFEVYDDLKTFINKLKLINNKAKVILTVSPVPLAATASNSHVLVATTASKSILRAVAHEISSSIPGVYYFPSYEIIVGHQNRGAYYMPDLRNVSQSGVNDVMKHFFTGINVLQNDNGKNIYFDIYGGYTAFLKCEESNLDK
jgi:hypothetical protein